MSVLHKLASTLGRRDEVPNQKLAREILRAKDKGAVKELVENLANKDKRIQSDSVTVLGLPTNSSLGMFVLAVFEVVARVGLFD